jgi:hypothetical protein
MQRALTPREQAIIAAARDFIQLWCAEIMQTEREMAADCLRLMRERTDFVEEQNVEMELTLRQLRDASAGVTSGESFDFRSKL